MRSKATNILQIGVLLSGVVYIVIGGVYVFSPIVFASIFGIDVQPDWYNLIKYDTFTAPIFHFSRVFAVMMVIAGISMILPLFDPLKYRGLIYYNSIMFPLLSVPILLINGFVYEHFVMIMCGFLFLAVFLISGFGLIITGKQTKMGRE